MLSRLIPGMPSVLKRGRLSVSNQLDEDVSPFCSACFSSYHFPNPDAMMMIMK